MLSEAILKKKKKDNLSFLFYVDIFLVFLYVYEK